MSISDKTEIDITKIHSNGRVQIPIEVRRQLNISDGDKIIWFKELGRIYIEKVGKGRGVRYVTI